MGFADAKSKYMCLRNIERPIVTTRTAIFPKLFFLKGLNKHNSSKPPKIPHKIVLITTDKTKFKPNEEYLSKYNKLDCGDEEKNNVNIAPSAIISPWAKFTIRVTPYKSERATEPRAIITPNSIPLPS